MGFGAKLYGEPQGEKYLKNYDMTSLQRAV